MIAKLLWQPAWCIAWVLPKYEGKCAHAVHALRHDNQWLHWKISWSPTLAGEIWLHHSEWALIVCTKCRYWMCVILINVSGCYTNGGSSRICVNGRVFAFANLIVFFFTSGYQQENKLTMVKTRVTRHLSPFTNIYIWLNAELSVSANDLHVDWLRVF